MSKSFFSKLLIAILVIVIIVLSYWIIVLRNEISENEKSNNQFSEETIEAEKEEQITDDASATEEVDASDDKIIVAIFNCVLGTFENNKWYNAQYGYESNLLLDKEIYEEEIENGFDYYLHEADREIKNLGKEIISKTEDYEYIVEENGMISDSHFRIENEFWNLDQVQIITNKEENIFPYTLGLSTASQDVVKIVNQAKKDLYIDMIETEISKIVSADYDKDGKQEKIVIVNTLRDELGYVLADNGACTLVITIDDNDYKVIYKDVVYEDMIAGVNSEMNTNDVVVTDINYNGKPEICISGGVWDVPIYSVHEYNDVTENFETVLYGEFAW